MDAESEDAVSDKIQEGHVVRVVEQSQTVNNFINMVGMVGFVEELQEFEGEKLVYFHELKLDDGCGGLGSIPVSCVKPVDPVADAEWVRAKERHDEHIDNLMREAEERTERRDKVRRRAIEITAAGAEMSPEDVVALVALHGASLIEASEELGDEHIEGEDE